MNAVKDTKSTIIIGVSGGSGSGKSTVVENLISFFQDASSICMDDYYPDRSHLSKEEQDIVNYDHPNSLDGPLLANHLNQLKNGQPIDKPIYDFVTKQRHLKQQHHPTKLIIVDGIFAFHNDELHDCYDYRIFLDVSSDIRFIRRLQRDMRERSRELHSVIDQYLATVRPMYEEFVSPQKARADLVLDWNSPCESKLDLIKEELAKLIS